MHAIEHLLLGLAIERQLSGEHHDNEDADGPDVAPLVDNLLLGVEDLGRQVL